MAPGVHVVDLDRAAADTAPPRRARGRRRGGIWWISYTEYDSTKSTYYTVAPPAPRAQLQTPVGNNKFDYMDYI